MEASTYNLASPTVIAMFRAATFGYTSFALPHVVGPEYEIMRLRPTDLMSHQRTYQIANFGFWNPDLVYSIPSPSDTSPDPTFPLDIFGWTGLISQYELADPADQITIRAKVRPPRSAWTGVSRRRRNLQ